MSDMVTITIVENLENVTLNVYDSSEKSSVTVDDLIDSSAISINITEIPEEVVIPDPIYIQSKSPYTIKDTGDNVLYSGTLSNGVPLVKNIQDGTITVNGDSYTNILAEGTLNVNVEYENGTPVGTINGSVVEIPNPIVPVAYNSINVIEYTANDTYIKPSNLSYAYVICIGAGGGGGGGGSSAGQMRGAGAGGGGALASRYLLPTELNGAGESITIGVGGVGGAGGVNTTGTAGTAGTATTFGSLVYADFGLGGDEGRVNPATASGAGGLILQSTPNFFKLSQDGGKGAAGGATGSAGVVANLSGNDVAGSEGGAGGGHTIAFALSNGARGGIAIDKNGTTWNALGGAGTVGGNGGDGFNNIVLQLANEYPIATIITKGLGTGGGGGGNATDGITNGGNGGNGGLYGAGGGGGGSAKSNGTGGNGGNGSNGLCIIIEYLF